MRVGNLVNAGNFLGLHDELARSLVQQGVERPDSLALVFILEARRIGPVRPGLGLIEIIADEEILPGAKLPLGLA